MKNQPLNTATCKILDALTSGIEVGEARKFEASPYQTAHVDRLTENRYSVAHYFTQYGDSVADPDGEFLRVGKVWFPVALQQCLGQYSRALELEGDKILGFYTRTYRELRSFATMWLRNIRNQQELGL